MLFVDLLNSCEGNMTYIYNVHACDLVWHLAFCIHACINIHDLYETLIIDDTNPPCINNNNNNYNNDI